MEIEPLNKDHDRNSFDCGNNDLNNFLKKTARQAADKNLSRTFVLTDGKTNKIYGFVSVTPCSVNAEDIPERHRKNYPPQHGIPAIRLARMGVDVGARKKGYGELLLTEALSITAKYSDAVGGIGLFVDAKDDTAKAFYERYGFVVTNPSKPMLLFMPLATIQSSLA